MVLRGIVFGVCTMTLSKNKCRDKRKIPDGNLLFLLKVYEIKFTALESDINMVHNTYERKRGVKIDVTN